MDSVKLERLNVLTQGDYAAFLYDCDGTLADNMRAHKDSFVQTASEFGFALDPALIDELAGWPTAEVVAEIGKRYAVSLDTNRFSSRKGAIFFDEYMADTRPIPYVVAHLKQHAGRVRIGVVSGGKRATVEKTLKILGIDHLIEVMVCAGETGRGKPFPDPFLKAAALLGVAPEQCMVFEDGDAGIRAALSAGMASVRIDKI